MTAALVVLLLAALALTWFAWRWAGSVPVLVEPPALPQLAVRLEPPTPVTAHPLPPPPAPPLRGPAPPAPVVSKPVRLKAAAVHKEIQRRIAPRARDCLARHTRLIKGQQFPVRVEILASGEARATATLATSPAARCIADLFRRHRFPANIGGLTIDHAFTP